jgi:beta-glucosidase
MTEASFLWGVATSAYQSEGGFNRLGEPQTNWASAEQQGSVDPLGDAAGFLAHYEEDLRRCQSLGLNAFRLSIEWSRIQPTFVNMQGDPPPFDLVALRQYAHILVACRAFGIEPIVTLHHFVHPAWLGSDPWLEQDVLPLFDLFVKEVVLTMNRFLVSMGHAPIRYFITINEPNMLVMSTYLGDQFPTGARRCLSSAVRAWSALMETHVRAYNLIHDLYIEEGWGAVFVTFNNYTSDIYWLDRCWTDLMMIRERGISAPDVVDFLSGRSAELGMQIGRFERKHLGVFTRGLGAMLRFFSGHFARQGLLSSEFTLLIEKVFASPRSVLMDYIAFDYYDPFCAHSFRWPKVSEICRPRAHPFDGFRKSFLSKWWDWKVLPEGLGFFSRALAEAYPGKPLLIAENGMANRRDRNNSSTKRRDRATRSDFIRMHASEVIALVQEGVPLFGYLHWSLFDNYEWGTYSARFGLFSLDYEAGLERCHEDHTGDKPSEVYAEIIRSAC